jgi:ribosomal protein S20
VPGESRVGHHFGLKGSASLDIAAKDLNMTAADLKTALQGGQSIAALAKSKSVDPQKIINDLVTDATTRIDAAVTSGKITAAEATKMKANLTTAIGAFVNGMHKPLGEPGDVTGTAVPKLGARPSLTIVAKDLNMGAAELKTALGNGQSIAALAKSKNVDPQKIINDLVTDATSRIDAAVSSGKITAAQATTMKANLTTAMTAFVNGTGDEFGPGLRGPFHGLGGPGKGGHRPTATATPASI